VTALGLSSSAWQGHSRSREAFRCSGAAELAVKEINARGGVRGRPLELRIVDDSGPRRYRDSRGAQAFVDDPAVVAVIGHLTSGLPSPRGGCTAPAAGRSR